MRLPTAYLPPLSWCAAFWNSDTLVLEACETYQKGSWRNRCRIAGPNGVQLLSIPLEKGKNNKMPVREVRIACGEPWQRQHWRSITTAYGNAPYFEHYADDLRPFYHKNFEFLFDFNLNLLEMVCRKMDWQGDIAPSAQFLPEPLPPEGEAIRYPQVFEEKHGFIPDLSVLDLLFCCGKQGGEILKKQA